MQRVMITGCNRGLGESLYYALTVPFRKFGQSGKVFPHFRKNTTTFIHPDHMVEGDITDINTVNNITAFMFVHDINVFINNAAIYSNTLVKNLCEKEINTVIATNFTAQVHLLKKVNDVFLSKGKGLIINISSLAAKNPTASESLYSATKAGVSAFLKSMQLENIGTNVYCMDVYIGAMKTDITKHREDHNSLMDPSEVAKQISDIVLNNNTSMYVNELTIRKT